MNEYKNHVENDLLSILVYISNTKYEISAPI